MNDSEFNPSEDYIDTVKNMQALYAFWNRVYFNGELTTPVITVRQDMKGRAYGLFPIGYGQPARVTKVALKSICVRSGWIVR